MNLSKFKISSILILTILIIVTAYLSVSLKEKNDSAITDVEILNTYHLSSEQYKSYAMLDQADFRFIDLSIIKDRLEKHPFVNKVDVKFDSENKVIVKISEKEFNAILVTEKDKFYLTDQFELLPFSIKTRDANYPIITNASLDEKPKLFHSLINNSDVRTAFKMIYAMKLLNPELLSKISEIDLRNGRDIVITLIDSSYPVVIGRENEVTKLAYFNRIWKFLKDENYNEVLDYIDFRYGKNVYLGLSEEKGIGV